MSIPKYPEFYPYILRHADKPKALADLFETIVSEMKISEENLAVRLPSGEQKARNRMRWAIHFLMRAGLVEKPSRGIVATTQRGKNVREKYGSSIDNNVLAQSDEFSVFLGKKSDSSEGKPTNDHQELTPTDEIENATDRLRMEIRAGLLKSIMDRHPSFFEGLVVQLLRKMGYGSEDSFAEAVGKPGDEGIDGVIHEDKLGLDAVYIQAKRADPRKPVGRGDLQKFAGALLGKKTSKGVFITTSNFSQQARSYADDQRIRCIDGQELANLMIDYEVGAKVAHRFNVYYIDEDFFSE